MATKTERVEARLSSQERKLIERAAAFEGQSLSSFMVAAATERAEQVISAQTTTMLPADYFDRLLAAIDRAEDAPRLTVAAKKARQHGRIR
ncbi:MAG: DUF1778 domain-containing protein [Actinomycetota bacterium]